MRASGIGFGRRLLLSRRGDEDRCCFQVDAVVGERYGLGEAQPDGAAEGDDPLDALREPGGEVEQFLVLERLTFASLNANRVDVEDADVDLLSARLGGPQCGLKELEFVSSCGRRDCCAGRDVVLDLAAPERRYGSVAERPPGADAVLVVADASGAERTALAAHRLLPLEQAVELVAEPRRLLPVEVTELHAELQVKLDHLCRLTGRQRHFRERADADLPAALAALADCHQATSLPWLEGRVCLCLLTAPTAVSRFAARYLWTALSE